MKFVSKFKGLAAGPGQGVQRIRARRSVVSEFLQHSVYGKRTREWDAIVRLMQCIDTHQPVVVGPSPAPPKRLFPLTNSPYFPSGLFAEEAPAGTPDSAWWDIAPSTEYLKWYLPPAKAGAPPVARYFLPSAIRGELK
ncbi:MAG: hypothetical protein KIT72_06330 [Polyangiaceae bacterium]|nr:hypothetical protein [Polyangiaceae bacterium]MCW5790018.1 hypothetical protein [Polyangiaceae bacterium]